MLSYIVHLIFKWIFKWNKWTVDNALLETPEALNRCVVTAAPHTSNWDLIYMVAAFRIIKIPLKFTIKKEWMRFPFNLFIGGLGAIAIDRSPKEGSTERKSMVEAMADLFDQYKDIAVVVTPEGSRSRRDTWKTGFYHVAERAKVPIVLGYLDYKHKKAGIGKKIIPSGDFAKDMKEICDFYATINPKFPELFALDNRYYLS